MKQCSQCKQWKDESEYYKYSASKDGLNARCKDCIKVYRQREDIKERDRRIFHEYYLKVKETEEYKKKAEAYREHKLDLNAKWREENKEHMKKYAEENKEYFIEINRQHKEQNRKYNQEHKKEIEEKYPTKTCSKCKQNLPRDMFYTDSANMDALSYWCKDCQREYNKQRDPGWSKEYYQNNKEKILRKSKEKNSLPQNKLSNIMRSGIYKCIKQNKAGYHWETLISYSVQELKEYLEEQFDENMSWDNIGDYWEIDHIIPVNTFNFTSYTDREFQICWSLMNLRPLEKTKNRSRPKDGSDIPQEIKNNILGQTL